MTTVLVNANRYRSLLQSTLVLVHEATDILADSPEIESEVDGKRTMRIPEQDLIDLHGRARAISLSIQALVFADDRQPNQPDSDRLSPTTSPVGIPSPSLSLSSAGDGQDAGESTPCTGEGNSAGASSRAPLRSS